MSASNLKVALMMAHGSDATPHPNELDAFMDNHHGSKPSPGSDEWLRARRESHKEVERRRREHINTGINELAKIVPNCTDRNKGGILHRAVAYINQLKETEGRNAERWTLDKMLADQAINDLSAYIEYLKAENEQLRQTISNLGGEAPARLQPPPPPSATSYPAHTMSLHPHFAHYFTPQHFSHIQQAIANHTNANQQQQQQQQQQQLQHQQQNSQQQQHQLHHHENQSPSDKGKQSEKSNGDDSNQDALGTSEILAQVESVEHTQHNKVKDDVHHDETDGQQQEVNPPSESEGEAAQSSSANDGSPSKRNSQKRKPVDANQNKKRTKKD